MVTLAVDGGVAEFTVAAVIFGIGAALVLDEFALILHLEDVYWSEDGRTSVDAVFVAVAVAGLLIMGFNPLAFFDINIWREDDVVAARAAVVGWRVLTLLLAVVVLLKGKLWTGLVGMGRPAAAGGRRAPAVPAARAVGAVALHRPGRRRCTVRWSVNAGCAARSCRPSCGCRACSPACRGFPTTTRWTPNWIARSTPPPRRRSARDRGPGTG